MTVLPTVELVCESALAIREVVVLGAGRLEDVAGVGMRLLGAFDSWSSFVKVP